MTSLTFEKTLRIEDEAIFAARLVGANDYKDGLKSGNAATCPYDQEKSGDPLDDIRMTAWYDGMAEAEKRSGGSAFEVLGTPTVVTLEAEHADGTITVSIPECGRPS